LKCRSPQPPSLPRQEPGNEGDEGDPRQEPGNEGDEGDPRQEPGNEGGLKKQR